MSNTFIKTIDNSSVLENAISLALQPYATMTYVTSYVSASLQGLATSSSVASSIITSLIPYAKSADVNTAINTAIQPLATTSSVSYSITNSLIPYSTTTLMNTAITASSLLPLANTWTGKNTFNTDVKLNSNLEVQLPGGNYSYTLDLGGFTTNETIYLWDDPLRIIIPVSSAVFGRTYRVITVQVLSTDNSVSNTPPPSLYNDAYSFANLRTGGVYLGAYDPITNNTKYGLLTIYNTDVNSGAYSPYNYKIWNIPFTMGYLPITLYLHTMEYSSDVSPFVRESKTGTDGTPYQPASFYAKITIKPQGVNTITAYELSYLKGATSNIQSQINGLFTATNTWTGNNIFRGVFNSIQSADTILPVSFSTTPSFSMTTGMVYNLVTTSTALTSLTLTNIPTTPQQTYVFTFLLQPTQFNAPWYLKPPTNFINITPIGASTISVPVYGISGVVFPSSYAYILQTITVVNTSTTTSPTFVSFLSVSAY
jgi:hypothetical protein